MKQQQLPAPPVALFTGPSGKVQPFTSAPRGVFVYRNKLAERFCGGGASTGAGGVPAPVPQQSAAVRFRGNT